MASRIIDRSALLDRLSDSHDATPPVARADEDLQQPSRHPGSRARHPRDVRVLPRSRDFH
jgi:error-prone DNA polymerase